LSMMEPVRGMDDRRAATHPRPAVRYRAAGYGGVTNQVRRHGDPPHATHGDTGSASRSRQREAPPTCASTATSAVYESLRPGERCHSAMRTCRVRHRTDRRHAERSKRDAQREIPPSEPIAR